MDYINQHAKDDQMTTTSGGYTDDTDLQGADNKYLFYYKEKDQKLGYLFLDIPIEREKQQLMV